MFLLLIFSYSHVAETVALSLLESKFLHIIKSPLVWGIKWYNFKAKYFVIRKLQTVRLLRYLACCVYLIRSLSKKCKVLFLLYLCCYYLIIDYICTELKEKCKDHKVNHIDVSACYTSFIDAFIQNWRPFTHVYFSRWTGSCWNFPNEWY